MVVASVPWARHGAGHTFAFDEQVAWLATACSKAAVTELMRISWRAVGSIMTRVGSDVEAVPDRFAGLRRIRIEKISFNRGHRHLTVVVDHDSGRLVWAEPGRDKATLGRFFDALDASGPGRGALRVPVPRRVVGHRRPRRGPPPRLEHRPRRGPPAPGRTGHRTRQGHQGRPVRAVEEPREAHRPPARQARLDRQAGPVQHRAYLLRESLCVVFQLPHDEAFDVLDQWIRWARRCRVPAFAHLQKRIVKHLESILAAIEHHLSNGLIESVNTKIRLITRIAFGFRSPAALIAPAMLSLGSHCPALPGQ